MLSTIAHYVYRLATSRGVREARDRLRKLSSSLDLAEQMLADHRTIRVVLVTDDEHLHVTGTAAEVRAVAIQMATRTRTCVTVAVPVAIHHGPGCEMSNADPGKPN